MLVTKDNFYRVCRKLRQSPVLSIDTETTGLDVYGDDRICGVCVYDGGVSYYFPYRHGRGYNLPMYTLPVLIHATSQPGQIRRMHNSSFDAPMMAKDGWPMPDLEHPIEENMIAFHLLNENEMSLKLKDLGDKYLYAGASQESHELDDALVEYGLTVIDKRGRDTGRPDKGRMWELPSEVVEPYGIQDAVLTWDLVEFAAEHLRQREVAARFGISSMYELWQQYNVYQMLAVEMESRGVMLDEEANEAAAVHALQRCNELIEQMRQMTGKPAFNPRSHPQVQKWLGVASSAREVLEAILLFDKNPHPGIEPLLEYRTWQRAEANYHRAFTTYQGKDGAVHAHIHLTGTISSRISVSKPPLQALPRSKEKDPKGIYKSTKRVLVARPGYVLLSADYSSAELYVLAHYSGDENLRSVLRNGEDLHQATALAVGASRQVGKTMNYSITYGIGASGLANDLRCSKQQAGRYLKAFYTEYPGIKRLSEDCERTARERGYISLFTGRRRHFNDRRKAPPHKAMSNLIQGTVAEMIRVAMTRIWQETKDQDVHILLQVHDDVKIEVPIPLVVQTAETVQRCMTDFPLFAVPMRVDITVGPNWGDQIPLSEWLTKEQVA